MSSIQFESQYPEDSWEGVIKNIIDVVDRGLSCQLLGLPGAGRYLILGLLAYNKQVREFHLGEKQKQYQFVYVDFSEVRGRPLSDVMKILFLALSDSLRNRELKEEYETVQAMFEKAILLKDELVLTEELKHAIEYLTSQKQMKIIYLFDRVEDFIPQANSQFFANLRILRNRAKYHFSAVFALNKPLEELLDQQILEDFYDLLIDNTIFMPLFDKPSVSFRLDYLEKLTGKKLSESVREELYKITGGHGKLMRMTSESYLSAEEGLSDLSSFFLKQKIVVSALDEVWLSFSPSEQRYLLNIKGDFQNEYLEKVGLLDNNTITIPLLSDYIHQERVVQNVTKAVFRYDPSTDRIYKGELILSDDLTSSEFLLLRQFVTHPEQILSREDLIHIVWSENKTMEGVSDQALDQLIFRLRQKIEEDPKAPEHIVTVKGRGFTFSS